MLKTFAKEFECNIVKEFLNKALMGHIMKSYNISRVQLFRILSDYNVPIPSVKTYNDRVTKSDKEKIISLYLNGKRVTEICNLLPFGEFQIRNLLKSSKIFVSKRGLPEAKFDHTFFKKIDSEEKAYFLGLLYADGNNAKKNRLVLGLSEPDQYLVFKLKELLNCSSNVNKVKRIQKMTVPAWRLEIQNKELSEDLTRLGVVKAKSLVLKFPTPEQVPEHLLSHFIRGYFDGDGCIWTAKDGNIFSEIISTESFCTSLKNHLSKVLNLKSNVVSNKRSSVKSLKISTRPSIVFFDHIYHNSSVRMERKYRIFLDYIQKYKTKKRSGGSKISEDSVLKIINKFINT